MAPISSTMTVFRGLGGGAVLSLMSSSDHVFANPSGLASDFITENRRAVDDAAEEIEGLGEKALVAVEEVADHLEVDVTEIKAAVEDEDERKAAVDDAAKEIKALGEEAISAAEKKIGAVAEKIKAAAEDKWDSMRRTTIPHSPAAVRSLYARKVTQYWRCPEPKFN